MQYNTSDHPLYTINEIALSIHRTLPVQQRPQIRCSRDAYALLKDIWDQGKIELIEQCKVILMNTNSKVLGVYNLADGGISTCLVDIRLILCAALKAGATQMIFAHNHPSGDTTPSRQDEVMTNRLNEAARLLDIRLNDHLVITSDHYLSFADQGLL